MQGGASALRHVAKGDEDDTRSRGESQSSGETRHVRERDKVLVRGY
jgi:hypothetical protein